MTKEKDAKKSSKPTGPDENSETSVPTVVAVATKEDPAVVRERMLRQLRDETQEEIRRFNPTLRESEEEFREAKEHAGSLKKIMEGNQKRLSMLCDRMTQAMDGTYQFPTPPSPTLPFPENKEDASSKPKLSAPDQAASLPIDALTAHGLTAKMCETLESHDIKTVGDIEQLMRTDAWWHKKIKGFGGERIDRTSDALADFRRAHPVPGPAEEKELADASTTIKESADDDSASNDEENSDGEE